MRFLLLRMIIVIIIVQTCDCSEYEDCDSCWCFWRFWFLKVAIYSIYRISHETPALQNSYVQLSLPSVCSLPGHRYHLYHYFGHNLSVVIWLWWLSECGHPIICDVLWSLSYCGHFLSVVTLCYCGHLIV